MSLFTTWKCDTCNKIINEKERAGWLELKGSLIRHTSAEPDLISATGNYPKHFCSWDCLYKCPPAKILGKKTEDNDGDKS